MFDFGFGFGFGCKCWSWNRIANSAPPDPETFSLPAPLPYWPLGEGFASGIMRLGEIEVVKVTRFESIWCSNLSGDRKKGVSFYKPCGIPDGFHCLGHYSQLNIQPLRGFLLVAREASACQVEVGSACYSTKSPPLHKPLDYTLIWSSDDGNEPGNGACCYFWLPQAPEGYKSLGFLVTNKPEKPGLDEVRCVRADLTDECQTYKLVAEAYSNYTNFPLRVWSMRPTHRGMMANAVSIGTFFCDTDLRFGERLPVACLKNTNTKLHAMPNAEQVNILIQQYGPTVFFHPEEIYLPSSVPWFFKNGALLYTTEDSVGKPIDNSGSNLPGGGTDDGAFWIDLPRGDRREMVKCGNLESAKLYVHVKPALGGTFTDIVMWVFCPFNGPATLKVGLMNVALSKVGEHVADWEHFTLRICNFTGELWSIYFSQHSGGEWVDAYNLEYIEGNRAIVYSSRNGHASFPHPGTYIQGSAKLGIGIRNDAARSNYFVDSSRKYEIVAAEYLNDNTLTEPMWLQYMRKWGPTIVYDSRSELDKIIKVLPAAFKYSVESIFNKLPVELYGEEGPTGPKEKDNWLGDERC